MMIAALISFPAMLLCSWVSWWVTRQGALGRLDRQGMNGIKTEHTRRSEAAWLAGHRAALPVVTRMAVTEVALAVAMLIVVLVAGDRHPWVSLAAIVIAWVPQLLVVSPVVRVANRAADAA